MKFFVDTANLAQIKEAHDLGILDGVTTNPSLMAKEGISGKDNVLRHYKAICDIVDGDVSAEVIATDYDGMIREGEELAELDDKIVACCQDKYFTCFSSRISDSINISVIKNYKNLGFLGDEKYFNSGVLLIDIPKWKRESISLETLHWFCQILFIMEFGEMYTIIYPVFIQYLENPYL
jgi:hypothetical protein